MMAEALQSLESQLSRLIHATITTASLERLNVARLGSSNTLLRDSQARERWDKSQLLIHKWIQEERPITWEAIVELHENLTGDPSQLRTQRVFTGRHEHLQPEDLPAAIERLTVDLKDLEANRHPVEAAALLRYWLVSIHPFRDGNGRTSTLAADWVLLRNGYPPFCFAEVIDGTVAAVPEGKTYATPERAIEKSIASLNVSFRILLGEDTTERPLATTWLTNHESMPTERR